ncbi:hypothetical protein WN944_020072 [Citrus x changshan-huyou]|uniref:Uncharacterized protein n=1 Tax=Citrus x changshan-huyou TaxID=2935761 RepID=A0AAP0LZF8_9ROSI
MQTLTLLVEPSHELLKKKTAFFNTFSSLASILERYQSRIAEEAVASGAPKAEDPQAGYSSLHVHDELLKIVQRQFLQLENLLNDTLTEIRAVKVHSYAHWASLVQTQLMMGSIRTLQEKVHLIKYFPYLTLWNCLFQVNLEEKPKLLAGCKLQVSTFMWLK